LRSPYADFCITVIRVCQGLFLCYSIATMSVIKLRIELRTLRHAIEELRSAMHHHSETVHATQERKEQAREIVQPVPVIVSYGDQTIKDTDAQNYGQNRTQKSIRNRTAAAVIAASLYAGIAALQWCEMRKATKAAQGQLALMRDADRPWIDIDISITSPLIYNGKVVQEMFTFIPTNIGRSPAENISINPILRPAFMFDDLQDIQKRLCDNAVRQSGPFFLKYALFPGHHYNQPIGLEVSIEDINSHWGKLPTSIPAPDPIPIALVGCVDYTYELSDRHHQTAFAFDLVTKEGGMLLKSKTPIPPSDFGLRTHPTKGDYPN